MSPAPATPSMTTPELAAQLAAFGIGTSYARRHHLRRVREPRRLVSIGPDLYDREQWLAPGAANAWLRLQAAAQVDGIEIQPVSAFRSIAYQCSIIERKLARGLTLAEILAVSAAPGYSEHHTGRALDVTTPGSEVLEESFEASAAYAWLSRHAAHFGFALSYPRGNRHGVIYEPWHWCWRRA